jgi:hypothetical protein
VNVTMQEGRAPRGETASVDMMKAVAVFPGKPGSMHLTTMRRPALADVPGQRGVLVKVLRVGVDGTDKEINAAEYGAAPPGDDFPSPGTRASASSRRSGRR